METVERRYDSEQRKKIYHIWLENRNQNPIKAVQDFVRNEGHIHQAADVSEPKSTPFSYAQIRTFL